ncbi:MAG: hypothetical protein KC931_18765, partial [Candidatus Omnitrophica bacterium]|nr:hypothetical protein [Candidatus Omnitrophota bacterium]
KDFPPVHFNIQTPNKTWEVELHGDLPFLWRDDARVVSLTLAPTSSCTNDTPSKHLLAPFLFHLSLLTLEGRGGERFVGERDLLAAVQFKDGIRIWKYSFDPGEAETYLENLLLDFLSDSDFGRLPLSAFSEVSQKDFKTILGILRNPDPSPEEEDLFVEIVEETIEKGSAKRFKRGMEVAELFEPYLTDRAHEAARGRLLPFLEGERIREGETTV